MFNLKGAYPVPASGARWYNIQSNAATKQAEIYLYGVIGGYYANVQQFLADLQAAGDVERITVYLNTIGGSFYDGLPIYNTLKQHKAQVTVKVMGYALSMGSVIMLAGDTVEAAENSLIMIHRAQGVAWGDADAMAQAATILQKHEQAILPEYMRRMGQSAQEVQALLAAETWYTATEAKQAGLIDVITEVVNSNPEAAKLEAEAWNYAAQHYRNIPQALLNRINILEEDEPVKPEDIQAITTAVVSALKASEPEDEAVSFRKYQRLEADYADLATRFEKMKNERIELQHRFNSLSDQNADLYAQVTGTESTRVRPQIATGPVGSAPASRFS